MGHGHSHGSDNHKTKNKKDKKDEDSIEIGESDHLCADDRTENKINHDYSHEPASLILNSTSMKSDDEKLREKKRKGSEK